MATLDITRTTFSDRDFLAMVQKLIVKLKLYRWDIFRRQQQEDNLVRMSTVDKDDSAFAPRLIDKLPLLPSAYMLDQLTIDQTPAVSDKT